MQVGELPTGWHRATVDDVKAPEKGSIVSGPFGSNIGKRFFVEEGVPVIRGNNLTLGDRKFVDEGFVFITEEKAHELRNCTAMPGDLVFTAAGTLGQTGLIPGSPRFPKYIISNKQLRLRCDPNLAAPEYLYYWFSSPDIRTYIASQNTGASVPLITLGILRSIPVNLPPLPTQRKIAAVLSAYDDLIENNTRRIRILEQMAQALYREWFVHFRFPGHEKVKLVASPVGRIPEGWEVKKLGDAIELAYGKGLKEENRCGGPVPVFGSGGVVGYHNECYVRGPGIVVGRKGNVGSVFWSDADFWPIDTTFFVVTELSLPYVFYDLLHQAFINNDAAVPGLSRNAAYLKTLLVPDDNPLTAFENVVFPIFSQLRVLREKNANLRHTRDLLLPRLISGEVDVMNTNINRGGGA